MENQNENAGSFTRSCQMKPGVGERNWRIEEKKRKEPEGSIPRVLSFGSFKRGCYMKLEKNL
jgi:hypothetical protein